MTSNEQTVGSAMVVDLHGAADRDSNEVGMKAAHLARLAGSGFPVPDGFVITTAACDRILGPTGCLGRPSTVSDIPPDIWAEVLSHLDRLDEWPVAVRSSGTVEDLGDASFAGQYDTVLGVEDAPAVAGAIGRCLASAFSEQVRAYKGSDTPSPMAVLIQRMVQADAAGVVFTANPVTGDDEVLVSAVRGLGDRLVSGQATPDEWVVRGGDVTCATRTEGVLDQNQATRIADMAKAAERLFGSPQDIEWAMAGHDLFVLQARPITALPVAPEVKVPTEGFWVKDTAHFPTPFTPFGASVYLPAISDVIGLFAEFGVLLDGLDQLSLGGEVYMRSIPMGGKDRPVPPTWVMWVASRLAPSLRRRARVARTTIRSGLAERIVDRWEQQWRPEFEKELAELRSLDLRALDDLRLLSHLDSLKALLRRGEDLHFRLTFPYALSLYELSVTCQDVLGWDSGQSLSLVTGASQASSEPGRVLQDLAGRIAADAPAFQALTTPEGDPLTELQRAAPWAAEEFNAFLERYCHRTSSYDPGDPTLFERPHIVVHLLAEQARAGKASEIRKQSQPDMVAKARAELTGRPEVDRARFEASLSFALRAYPTREDNIYWLDNYPCALLRYCALEIGRRLAERGLLVRASDAVYLEEHELRRAMAGNDSDDLRALISRRKAERAWVIGHPGPPFYGTPPGPPPDLSPLPADLRHINNAFMHLIQSGETQTRRQDAKHELRGVPASPGRYTGPVRVLRDETEFAKLESGDVLVCPATSPSWSLLFLQAGAVITDGGGVLSHTAVIAREYGIPAVLATGEATRRLSDGDLVTVDGNTGVVSIADDGGDDAHEIRLA